jgi:geranylgeranyl diphosphate synthase type I
VTASADVTALPAEIAIVNEPLRARLEDVLAAHLHDWTRIDPALAAPLVSIRDLVLAGGKRLRPAFCYWGFRAAGGAADDTRVIDAGAAYELLHAFALIHDDVMDGSRRRRGAPSVHVAYAEEHERHGWRGEPRRFGEGVAILVGDLTSVMADELLAGAPPDAVTVWNRLRLEVNIGQYLDVLGAADGTFDLERARRVARYKSGKYTVERPLHLGAALAGGLAELAEPLSAYGAPLGEAFQLRDDLLGVFGDPEVTGKPVGDDLREGKPTTLLVLARERAEPSDLRLLARVGSADLDGDDVAALRSHFERCGARAAVEQAIDELTAAALHHLDTAEMPAEVRAALRSRGHDVGRRDH